MPDDLAGGSVFWEMDALQFMRSVKSGLWSLGLYTPCSIKTYPFLFLR